MSELLGRAELAQMMDLATRCLSVATDSQLGEIVSQLASVIPFRRAVLCAVRLGDAGYTIEHLVNHSYGSQWETIYTRNGFWKVDPVLNFQPDVSAVFSWKDALRTSDSSIASEFLLAAREFDLVDGLSYTCGFRGVPGFRSLLSLAGTSPHETDRMANALSMIGPHVHEAYGRLVLHSRTEGVADVLSPREREVLGWLQRGKTYWELAQIIGISERTVKFHVARIKSKLSVVSPAHAVATAMRSGIIA